MLTGPASKASTHSSLTDKAGPVFHEPELSTLATIHTGCAGRINLQPGSGYFFTASQAPAKLICGNAVQRGLQLGKALAAAGFGGQLH